MTGFAKVAVSLVPVLAFLASLIYLDSFKLVRVKILVGTLLYGALAAAASWLINSWILGWGNIELTMFQRYAAPVVEEIMKAIMVVILIRSRRLGFAVDAGIYGFAVGAGFALVENIYYLVELQSANILVWIVRGIGTAVTHGGTVAVYGMVSKSLFDRHPSSPTGVLVPGLLLAIVLHSAFNHFILPPEITTIVSIAVFSVLVVAVFHSSEVATRKWLGVRLDTEMGLLETIVSGGILQTRTGRYLQSLKAQFPGEVVGDMLCYLRLYLELALHAKGILLMREAGLPTAKDPDVVAKLEELRYLESRLGRTGKLAVSPLLRMSNRDLWQLNVLS